MKDKLFLANSKKELCAEYNTEIPFTEAEIKEARESLKCAGMGTNEMNIGLHIRNKRRNPHSDIEDSFLFMQGTIERQKVKAESKDDTFKEQSEEAQKEKRGKDQ